MEFNLINTDGHARRGRLTFARGVVETPIFMPVGTYGAVKSLTPKTWPVSARKLFWAIPSIMLRRQPPSSRRMAIA